MLQVRIKQWFLIRNNMYDSRGNKDGKYNEYSWLTVTRETEKAYHLDQMQYNIPQGGWIPKSVTLEVREV